MIINPVASPISWEKTILSAQVLVGNGFTYTNDALNFFAYRCYQNAPANGDSFGWYANLQAGTYKMGVWFEKYTDRGKQDISIGSIAVGTIDTYNAALNRDQLTIFTGIIIPSTGNYLVKSVVNGKNGASTNFFMMNSFWYITQ